MPHYTVMYGVSVFMYECVCGYVYVHVCIQSYYMLYVVVPYWLEFGRNRACDE